MENQRSDSGSHPEDALQLPVFMRSAEGNLKNP